MIPEKVLCFELFGDYAQFKKFFTNMSPTSFSIPPRTAIAGIIGAIVGIDKTVNPEHFSQEDTFIALQLINPVKKTRIAQNYLKTTSPSHLYDIQAHKPTNVEFLKDVRFRIFFSCKSKELYTTLLSLLERHQSVYTISLGISNCLANYDYLGEFCLESIQAEQRVDLNSVVPMDSVSEVYFNKPLKLQRIVLPSVMKNDREVVKYDEVLVELCGDAISLTLKDQCFRVIGLETVIHGV